MYINFTYKKLQFSINDEIHILKTFWGVITEFSLEMAQFKAIRQHMQPHEAPLLRGPPDG
jgi:hypothetical protein